MNVALRVRMTVEEFLAWEAAQPERWEFDGREPVAMVGGTAAHAMLCLNVGAELRARLRGGPCRAFVEGLKIMAAGRVRYPDVVVTCSPVANTATVADNPVAVFEVTSPGTADTDLFDKAIEYRDTPSIARYVLPSQQAIAATMYERRGAAWVGSALGADAVLAMPEIGVPVPLAELYEGVIGRP